MVLPVVGLLLLCAYAAIAVSRSGRAQEVKQPLPTSIGDLARVKSVEIKDSAGRVVLSGNFVTKSERDGDIEGKAVLTSTDANARGAAEFEISTGRNGKTVRELEVEVRQLAAGAQFTLFLDGQQAATFSTNQRGAAELEMTDEPSS
jgi:hypothetical protein